MVVIVEDVRFLIARFVQIIHVLVANQEELARIVNVRQVLLTRGALVQVAELTAINVLIVVIVNNAQDLIDCLLIFVLVQQDSMKVGLIVYLVKLIANNVRMEAIVSNVGELIEIWEIIVCV